MPYPPGISGTVGGLADSIVFTFYNSTDQAIPVEVWSKPAPPDSTSETLAPSTTVAPYTDPANPPTLFVGGLTPGVYEALVNDSVVATDVVVGATIVVPPGTVGGDPSFPPGHHPVWRDTPAPQ